MSAGLTSGIDASLHVIGRLIDDATARRVAWEIRYPNYHFALDPTVDPYAFQASDAVLLVNAAYRIGPARIAVGLYSGMSELDLSNIYDAHAITTVADLEGVGLDRGVVVTAHGMTLLPSRAASEVDAGSFDRFIVLGVDARERGGSLVGAVAQSAPSLRPEYLQADVPERFGLEPVIEDLARSADVPTARFALRRLEYRSESVRLEGDALPWRALAALLLLGAVGVAAVIGGRKVWRRRRGEPDSRPLSVRQTLLARCLSLY
jgi:hypothetical protein